MSQQITWNFRVIQWNPFLLFQFSANFSFGARFDNEVPKIVCWNFNRIIFKIKIEPLELKTEKRVKSTEFYTVLIFDFTRFQQRIKYNFSFCESILMQDSVLEALWVVDFTIEILAQNFYNFIVKFGSKAEIWWKLEE